MLSYLKQFASSLLPTLLLEGILLLPFGFWDRRNARLFLGVNIGTQLLLTVVTAACMRMGMPFYRYLVFAPLELVIWIIEPLFTANGCKPGGKRLIRSFTRCAPTH